MTVKSRKFSKGIRIKPTTLSATLEGEIRADSSALRFKAYIEGSERTLVTEDQTQTLTNKDIDADNNTLSNIETDNLKAGVLNTDLSGAATDTELPSALAVKTALEGQNEASEITYDPSGNPETTETNIQAALDDTGTAVGTNSTAISDHVGNATGAHAATAVSYDPASSTLSSIEVQDAIDDLDVKVQNNNTIGGNNSTAISDHLLDATDAHDASAISNVPSGNLAATDQQAVNDELQTDIDTRATSTDLTTHTGASTGVHGVTGDVVGTTDAQSISNKTLTNPIKNDIQTSAAAGSVSLSNPTSPVVEFTGAVTELIGIADSGNQEVTLINRSGSAFNIINEDTGASTSIRILTGTGKDLELADNQAIKLQYSSNESRWNVIGGTGSGTGGSGGINYIENSDFEEDVTGWSNTGAISIAAVTSDLLRGEKNLGITKASDVSGSTISYDLFTIDKADLAKKLTISFDYDFSNGYADGDIRVQIVKDPNGTAEVIRVNGEDIKAGKGTHYAQFQTDATEQEYRLELYWVDSGTGIVSLNIDNVVVGPTNLAFGTIVTDWEDFTPSYSGFTIGNGTNSAYYRRVGDSIEVFFTTTLGSTSSMTGPVDLSLPNSLNMNTNIISDFASNIVGEFSATDTGTQKLQGSIEAETSSSVRLYVHNVSSVYSKGAGLTSTVPMTWTTGDVLTGKFSVPIQGWSSNTQMSEDLGGREVVCIINDVVPSQTTIANSYASSTNLTFASTTNDTAAIYNTSTGQITIPETGYYEFDVEAYIQGTEATGNFAGIYMGVNGVSVYDRYSRVWNAPISAMPINTHGTRKFTKGDIVDFRIVTNNTAVIIATDASQNKLTINKLASPQTILETETVAARYTSDSGQAIGTSSTDVLFEDLGGDTHNAYNTSTGEYTIPTSGWYGITSRVGQDNTSTTFLVINIEVDGSDIDRNQNDISTDNFRVVEVNSRTYLEKDQVVKVTAFSSSSSNLSTEGFKNVFSIARIK